MLPLRLPRPLRPWQSPRTSARARSLSHRSYDATAIQRGHGAPGGGEPGQPATEETPEAAPEAVPSSNDAPPALRGLPTTHISTRIVKPSPSSPAPLNVQLRNNASSEHAAPPSNAPSLPPSGTSCLVCRENFRNATQLRIHIWTQNHVESWPAAFRSREEAVEGAARTPLRQRFQQELGTEGWRAAPYMIRWADGKQICKTCNTHLPTKDSRIEHWLSNEACRKDDQASPNLFACWSCLKTFESYAQARQHIQVSPRCISHMRARYDRTIPSYRLKTAGSLATAESCYRRSIAALLRASSQLETFTSPSASSLAPRINRHLLPFYREAQDTRDKELLSVFGTYSDTVDAIKKSTMRHVRVERSPSTSSKPITSREHANDTRQNPHRELSSTSEFKTTSGESLSTKYNSSPAENVVSGNAESHGPVSIASDLASNEAASITGSPTDPDATNAELRIQLQHLTEQVKLLQDQIKNPTTANMEVLSGKLSGKEATSKLQSTAFSDSDGSAEPSTVGQRLVRQIHSQARLMKSSNSLDQYNTERRQAPQVRTPVAQAAPASPPAQTPSEPSEMSEQSLLDELFPEASNYTQPHYSNRNPYPKLNPPSSTPIVRTYAPKEKLSGREKYMQAFQRSAEKLTALQLVHCSTELTEADFRRLVPKGQHIEGWARDGDFHKIIPGRDPVSLERLPFYYLIFKNPEAALRYQNNAYRLHKLSKLHGPNSSMSAIPPPPGLLESGEDINAALSSYLLTPASQNLQLNMVVQPYNPALSRLIESGGYAPVASSTTPAGKPIHKVLFFVEGYEPSPYDLYQIFKQDGIARGLAWPFLHEHQSIYRLRDIVDLKARFNPVASANPWSSTAMKRKLADKRSEDPYDQNSIDVDGEADSQDAKTVKQIIMNKVYNRWIIEFSEEAGARRFARLWHRKVLPMQESVRNRTWRDVEEARICNAEYLW